jgi:hypothetical protein
MKRMLSIWKLCPVLLVALFLGVVVQGQTVHGTLAGVVSDSTGAVIAGAKVSLRNNDTAAAYATTTTSAGVYRFEDIALGKYTVTVAAAGFKTSITKQVLVQIGTVSAVDVALQPGAVSEEVTVTSEGPTLETESSDIGGVISDKQIVDLPLALGGVGAMRANEAFVFLQPATAGPGATNSSNGIFLSKVAGGQTYGNEVLIDGASPQRSENGSSYDETAPSVEALAEFKVTTSLPVAEFGRTTGGVENFVTKSGTNEYHGTGYDIYRDRSLDTNSFFNKGWRAFNCTGTNDTPECRTTYDTPPDHKNDYGVTLGGPVRIPHLFNGRDKSFFFFSWEQLKYATGGTTSVTVPTAAERSGDFSDRLTTNQVGTNPCDGTKIYEGEIFDPSTTKTVSTGAGGTVECRTAFGGNANPTNVIPGGRESAVAKALIAYYPNPTTKDVFNNYQQKSVAPITNTTYSIRIDQTITDKAKVWGSYNTRENDLFTGGLPLLPSPVSPQGWWQDFTTHFFRVGMDYSITPSLLNYLVLGSNRTNSKNFSQAAVLGKDWNGLLGLGNAGGRNFPRINTGDAQIALGGTNNDDNVDAGLRLNEAIVWTHGRHNFKFGTDIRWQQYSPINGRNENINFSGSETAGAQGQGGGLGFASLFLGQADGSATNVVVKVPRWTSWYYAMFAQDDFKVTPTLTLNIGLRYDVDVPRKEAHNLTSNFSPTAQDTEYGIPGALVFGDKCKCNTRWANTWMKDFGPRLGFAWSPEFLHQKTVIRGGAGILYGPLVYDDFGGSMVTGYTANPNTFSPNGFDPSFAIDNGMPAFTPPPDQDPGYYNGSFLPGSYITPTAGRPATVYNWNLEIQHQLADDLLATVGYIGNHATNLESNLLNPNNMPEKYFALGNDLYQPFNGNKDGIAAPFPQFMQNWGGNPALQSALRPFPQYDFIDQGCCLENVGMSSFNALVATVQRRFKDGLNLQGSYTWEKTFTDADSALPNSGPGISQDMEVNNLHKEKALSAMDTPQTLVISALYELPFGKGKNMFNHGIAAQVLGGWEIGTVQRMQSGQPLSFGCEWGIPGFQNCIRFSKVPGSHLKSAAYRKGASHINPFVNIAPGGSVDPNSNTMFNLEYNDVTRSDTTVAGAPIAFYNTNQNYARDCTTASMSNCQSAGFNQPYTFGTGLPRTTGEVRTPPYFNNDLSIIKRFPVYEKYTLSLKAEFLNAFNQHTFGIPYGGGLDPNNYGAFGLPYNTVNGPRTMQLTGRFVF